MTWREDLRRVKFSDGRTLIGATFRGVPFFVEASERGGGRRTVKHQFPYRDDPFIEDLGRDARTFHVDGYVLGDDYLTQRDALLAVLEDEAGPGELVHPYHGVRRAICEKHGTREARDIGGIAMIAMDFAEAPAQAVVPTVVVDSAGQVSTSADAAHAATKAELVEKFDPSNLQAFAFASAETALKNASAGLNAKLGPIISTTQEAAQLTGQVALLTAETSSLVRQPAGIVDAFLTVFAGLSETILASPGAVWKALVDAYDVDLGTVVVATTATRARELANQTALTGALRRVFAIEAARLAPLVPYTSSEDALAARDQVAAMLEEQAELAGDTAYPALVNLRSEVLRAVPGGAAFASVVTVSRNVPIPSLLLAYQLYGAVDREQDVIARNGIRHPGFVAGDLKVLSDG